MKWMGDPETDLRLSLLDTSGSTILGQVIKDGEGRGWHGHDHIANGGGGYYVGRFDSPQQAKVATAFSVNAAMTLMSREADQIV